MVYPYRISFKHLQNTPNHYRNKHLPITKNSIIKDSSFNKNLFKIKIRSYQKYTVYLKLCLNLVTKTKPIHFKNTRQGTKTLLQ